jgi:RIO kinase 1
MWEHFQQNTITPEIQLTGRYRPSERRANTHAVLELIQDANYDERKRREARGLRGGPPADGASLGGPRGGSSPRSPSSPYQGRPQHRPAPPPEMRPRSAPPQGNASPRPSSAGGPGPGAPHGQRPEGRRIDVILARRAPVPRV